MGNGSPNQNHGTAARGSRRRSGGIWRFSNGTNPDGGGGRVLLTTGVSQPTINPTWPVSDTSWLHADAKDEQDLDSTRCKCSYDNLPYRVPCHTFSFFLSTALVVDCLWTFDSTNCERHVVYLELYIMRVLYFRLFFASEEVPLASRAYQPGGCIS